MGFTIEKGSEKGSQNGGSEKGVSRRCPERPLVEYAPLGVHPTCFFWCFPCFFFAFNPPSPPPAKKKKNNKGWSSEIVFQLQPTPPGFIPHHRTPSQGVDFESIFGRFRVDFESILSRDSKTTQNLSNGGMATLMPIASPHPSQILLLGFNPKGSLRKDCAISQEGLDNSMTGKRSSFLVVFFVFSILIVLKPLIPCMYITHFLMPHLWLKITPACVTASWDKEKCRSR